MCVGFVGNNVWFVVVWNVFGKKVWVVFGGDRSDE
tara:strand:+ start:1154 stop:1258 length:105 start_codon:yes stop_codon:yes gene_type:complete